MKPILTILLLSLLGLSTDVLAQHNEKENTITINDSSANTAPTVYKYNRLGYVHQSSGRVYSGDDLSKMPAKSVNEIANTVPGVQVRTGEPMIIRGAINSTAYFVDGMRIYGAMPLISH